MPEERVHVELAFEGGQTIAAVVRQETVDEFRRALAGEGANGVFQLEAEDGTYLIPLRSVVYLKRFSRETRIGFGGG